jgi:dolichol kinase
MLREVSASGAHAVIGIQVLVAFFLLVGFQVAVSRLAAFSQEATRRWQHAVTGHAFVVVSYLIPIAVCIPLLYLVAAGILYLRVFHQDLFLRSFGPLLRPREKQAGQLPGAFYFVLGTALTASLFPINAARYALECLSIADPVAAWVGRSVPSFRIHESASVAGSVACFVTAWVIGYLYLATGSAEDAPLGIITWGALACCLAEASPVGNDNLLIPIATAAAVVVASSSSSEPSR